MARQKIRDVGSREHKATPGTTANPLLNSVTLSRVLGMSVESLVYQVGIKGAYFKIAPWVCAGYRFLSAHTGRVCCPKLNHDAVMVARSDSNARLCFRHGERNANE